MCEGTWASRRTRTGPTTQNRPPEALAAGLAEILSARDRALRGFTRGEGGVPLRAQIVTFDEHPGDDGHPEHAQQHR